MCEIEDLWQIVNKPTHGNNILDTFLTNRTNIFHRCRVITSLIPPKHKAVLINCDWQPKVKADVNKRVIKFYDVRQPNIDILNEIISNYNWSHLKIDSDINSVYRAFLVMIKWHIELCAPQNQVTLSSKAPSFITPLNKSLLCKRNKLMHPSKLDEANEITIKIGYLIAEKRSNLLFNVDATSTKQLWDSVKQPLVIPTPVTSYLRVLEMKMSSISFFCGYRYGLRL